MINLLHDIETYLTAVGDEEIRSTDGYVSAECVSLLARVRTAIETLENKPNPLLAKAAQEMFDALQHVHSHTVISAGGITLMFPYDPYFVVSALHKTGAEA